MRRALKVLILAATLATVWSPAPASADGFVSPWIGVNFADDPQDGSTAFGITAGGMGGGIIGGEVDFGYSRDYFGDDSLLGDNYVMNLMGNLIIGIPIGGQSGAGIRPYGTGGIGLIRTQIDGVLGDLDTSTNDFGFNLGFGVMGFFADHFGIRGDVRYFRTIGSDLGDSDFDPEFNLGDLDFWRASFGVVFR